MMSSKPSSSSIRKGGGGARISRSREQHTGSVSYSCDWPMILNGGGLAKSNVKYSEIFYCVLLL